mgnify:CR=1 FL=1
MKTIIYNADIANEGRLTRGYIVIDDEIIAEVGEGEPAAAVMAECDVRNDVDGALVMPGVIDDQVHFRDPGLTHKADIATESAAAVAGGVTSYMDMPNTVPPTVTIDALEAKNRRAQEVSVANYGFFIGATNDNLKTLMAVDYSYTPGVKLFLGASTGNMLVSDRDALHDIFAEVPALVAIHSEDEQLIRRNREFYIKKYGDDLPVKFHPLIRSTEVCYKSTARAVEWAEKYGTRLHVLHVSTARELELFDNRPLLEKQKMEGVTRKLVGFEMVDRGIPRHGYELVNAEGEQVGVVTSGTMSPVLKKGIGMGYVKPEFAKAGTDIFIKVRNKNLKAQVVKAPFRK